MDTVEMIKKICKERKIPIARLERECGFSNGYIRGLRKGNLPSDKLKLVSGYLNISMEELTKNEPASAKIEATDNIGWYLDPETAKVAQEVFENPETRMLFDAARNAKPEDIRLAAEMLKRFKETNPDG